MKKLIMLILVISIFYSCSSFVYYPSVANAPLLQEKDETKVSVGIKGYSLYLNTSYAVTDHIAVQINGHLLSLPVSESGDDYKNGNAYTEMAIGLYYPFAKNFVAELYLGGGLGYTGYQNISSGTSTHRFHNKIFLQGDLGFTLSGFEIGFLIKGSYVDVFMERVNGVDSGNQKMDIFFEPAVFMKFGWDQHKINLQAGLSFATYTNISYAPFILAVGYEYSFSFQSLF